MPVPAVLGNEAAATGTESIIFAVTLHDGGRVVDERSTDLCNGGLGCEEGNEGNGPQKCYP